MDADQNTALLYFTLSADEEARAKRFTGSNSFSDNRSIAQSLIDNTYRQIRDTGLPVITFSSEMQIGDTFGERLSNAFATVFDSGYENVIAIGNDCPGLTSSHINRAGRSLETNALVIGPATDGGAYLIGINRNAFDWDKFSELSWETNSLLTDLVLLVTKSDYSVKLLDELSDIDNHLDLVECVQHLRLSPRFSLLLFSKVLSSILFTAGLALAVRANYFPDQLFFCTASSHRGPPGSDFLYP